MVVQVLLLGKMRKDRGRGGEPKTQLALGGHWAAILRGAPTGRGERLLPEAGSEGARGSWGTTSSECSFLLLPLLSAFLCPVCHLACHLARHLAHFP